MISLCWLHIADFSYRTHRPLFVGLEARNWDEKRKEKEEGKEDARGEKKNVNVKEPNFNEDRIVLSTEGLPPTSAGQVHHKLAEQGTVPPFLSSQSFANRQTYDFQRSPVGHRTGLFSTLELLFQGCTRVEQKWTKSYALKLNNRKGTTVTRKTRTHNAWLSMRKMA